MYRLNTYPVIHNGFFHACLNVLALTPLLERFEAEHGTLTAVALFLGRKLISLIGREDLSVVSVGSMLTIFCAALSTFPAGLYILIEKFILHSSTPVTGARFAIRPLLVA